MLLSQPIDCRTNDLAFKIGLVKTHSDTLSGTADVILYLRDALCLKQAKELSLDCTDSKQVSAVCRIGLMIL